MASMQSIAFLCSTVAMLVNADVKLAFNDTFSSFMVLQQAPPKSAVYGTLEADGLSDVTVTVIGGGVVYTVAATVTEGPDPAVQHWKAFLKPTAMGGNYTVTASMEGGPAATIADVAFGDVWYCAGQSNMWLPLTYTFQRNMSVAGIKAGKYDNIRLMAGDSQRNVSFPWLTTRQALAERTGAKDPSPPFFDFSAVCYYYAESLTDAFRRAGQEPPVFGLINTAIGGSMIEEWSLNTTTEQCANASRGSHDQTLYDNNVRPYLGMSLKGWLWYQGENNCHGTMGNSIRAVGYGCQLPAMVRLWREQWSMEAGTTDPIAPFGVVTLASGGSEGGSDIGGMRWSQTANYGVLPNPAMPNTFLAQAYDLGDPWGDKTCYYWKCCSLSPNYNATACAASTAKVGAGPDACSAYCEVLYATPVYMGGIHPRIKKPVGERLATAAMAVVYGASNAAAGPTIAGCALHADELVVAFDESLLRGDEVEVQDYNRTSGFELSAFQVLTNSSFFCTQPDLRCRPCPSSYEKTDICDGVPDGVRPSDCGTGHYGNGHWEWYCPDGLGPEEAALAQLAVTLGAGMQGAPPPNPYESASNWVTVNITRKSKTEVSVDLSSLSGATPVAIRYAWGNTRDSCCENPGDKLIGISKPCREKACPIMSSSGLPANPFMSRIVAGRCKCTEPQQCDGEGGSLVV